MNYKIRTASKEDCKEIHRMIMELALYENVAEEVKITHEDLERDGFGQNPFFESLVAEVPEEHKSSEGHTVVGYALYFYSYSTMKRHTLQMIDLYVMQEFRGSGIGKALLSKVAEVGKKKQCMMLKTTVFKFNTPAREFYAAKGAVDLTESEGLHFLSFHGQNLDNLANEDPGEEKPPMGAIHTERHHSPQPQEAPPQRPPLNPDRPGQTPHEVQSRPSPPGPRDPQGDAPVGRPDTTPGVEGPQEETIAAPQKEKPKSRTRKLEFVAPANMNFKIRTATKEDCKDIHRMIMDLAIYENMLEQVTISVDDLECDGFGQNPCFECLVAEVPEEHKSKEGHRLVGYTLYLGAYSSWKGRAIHLEDLYVMQEFRGIGIGKALLSKVAEMGKKKRCQRLQLTVLDWNKPSRDFYAAKGAVDLTESEGRHFLSFYRQSVDNLASEAPRD
ncbi:spermidine/spermine N(1)-acetyltransferase-like protein 1 [Antennarius striatus]|uniref:spermidine/spermine N(1)-acetyltransferase-like protein 1 n=1 Tax=Antennarius striatus TaxID=241820 RepID=UPI0035AFFB44